MMWWISCGLVMTWITLVLGKCNFPPSVWCSSDQIAKDCGVYKQCEDWSVRSRDAPPVNVTLYYESLCPDCRDYIKDQLYNTMTALADDMRRVLNVTLVPYGNAKEEKLGNTWLFSCQHGTDECVGNQIHTCAINMLQNVGVYFPFIYCMEISRSAPVDAAKECASQMGLSFDSIMNCTNSATGNQLEHAMALRTEALEPPHTFVPWITLNGMHTDEIQNKAQKHLLELVCDTYQGSKPDACSQMKTVSG